MGEFLNLENHLQEELDVILNDSQIALAACEDLAVVASPWRVKICKFQVLAQIRTRLLALKIKAAAEAAATVPAEPADEPVQSNNANQSPAANLPADQSA